MTERYPGFGQKILLDGSPLLRTRRAWTPDARAAFDDLLRQLDRWARSHDLASTHNPAIAEAVIREAWGATRWRALAPPLRPQQPAVNELPHDLRRWPAVWRYRVAALERRGMAREAAIDEARVEVEASRKNTVPLCA